jgi:hypothetical protein
MREEPPRIKSFRVPTKDNVDTDLEKTELETEMEELFAKRSGIPIEEFQNKTRESFGVEHPNDISKQTETEFSPMQNYINKWEKENLVLLNDSVSQIAPGIPIIPNSKLVPKMSRAFVSHVLDVARTKMLNDRTYKERNAILGSFLDIRKIEIKHLGGANKLVFEVSIDKGSDKQKLVVFVMDANGEISLPH